MNPTEEFEIYQFLCKEAEAYVSLSQLLKDAHLTMEAASSAVADFRKQFQDGLQHWQISNQNPAAISLGLLQALQEHPGDSQLSFLYAAWITDRGLLFDWHPENRSEEQDIRVWLKQSKTVSEFQAFLQKGIEKSPVQVDVDVTRITSAFSLQTCSYETDNSRTFVIAVPVSQMQP